ncbi:hypothetical protein CEE37_05865 [candidate division LCP-89 bacterium B3_LCP]|uniref:Zinc finger CHC2-type domain-containing protein n=1 Tax=candidate division LCP-89 bacterium B3_LCP TaxID=2012998 RepID=A0A532V1U3_UNCL8|nr:MAG: hypothetical protein CEE37_05865 [candidate division LCP-89 bacterium B3_LCP]
MTVIDKIKQDLLISDIISELQMKNTINCPFDDHTDENASFVHYPESNSFNCFGCNRGGTVIDFLMHLNNWSVKDAINHAKDQLGIHDHELTLEEVNHQERVLQRTIILEKVTNHCFDILWTENSSQEAKKARSYLKKRGFKEKLLKSMRIGIINIKSLRKSISDECLELAGLLVRKKDKLHPIVSATRLWYPVIKQQKVVYGICGKFLEDDSLADRKYINLAAGPLKIGSKTYLYNMDASFNRNEVYIAEGIPDTLTALSLGLDAVGILGADNLEDPKIFSSTREVYIIADNDDDRKGWLAALNLGLKTYAAQSERSHGETYLMELPTQERAKAGVIKFEHDRDAARKIRGSLPKIDDYAKLVKIKDLNDWFLLGNTIEDFNKLKAQSLSIISTLINYLSSANIPLSRTDNYLNSFVYKPLSKRGDLERNKYAAMLAKNRKEGGLGITKIQSEKRFKEMEQESMYEENKSLSPTDQIHKLRIRRGLPEYLMNQEVKQIFLPDLFRLAKLYTDANTKRVYFFMVATKTLVEISAESKEYQLLMGTYKINPTDRLFKYLKNELCQEAWRSGKEVPIHRFSYFDRNSAILYISASAGEMYKLNGDTMQKINNGEDNVFLLPQHGSEPILIEQEAAHGSV